MATIQNIPGNEAPATSRAKINSNFTAVNDEVVAATSAVAGKENSGTAAAAVAAHVAAGDPHTQYAPKDSPTFTGTATVETLVITKGVTIAPAPMLALVIDIKEQRNTKSLSTSSTLTLSATPTAGDTFGAILTEASGSEITVTIPECYSANRGGLITDFVLAGNAVAELGFWHDGTQLNISGDPRTQAQERTALGLGDSATRNVGTTVGTVLDGATKLDDLATPDDNTDLNATTGRHGLLPKLGGGTTNFLRADGTWATPAGGGGSSGGPLIIDGGTAAADPAGAVIFDGGDATTA